MVQQVRKYALIKDSSPGWVKYFSDLHSLVVELRRHICEECLKGGEVDMMVFDTKTGEFFKSKEKFVRPTPNPNSVSDLLATDCGCEYEVIWPDEIEDNLQDLKDIENGNED